MKEIKFRTLRADEIECRVGTQDKNALQWCTILLYKDARADMKLLDEVVGPMNWKREHVLIDGQLFCNISIWDEEKREWVYKQDVGTESNTDAQKGRASDACKRACVNWGIGRELYTAPTIFIKLTQDDVKSNGQFQKLTQTFAVKSIDYDADGNIVHLVIVDKNGRERFRMGNQQSQGSRVEAYNKKIQELTRLAKACNTIEELTQLKQSNSAYSNDQTFRDALNARFIEIRDAA